MIVLGVSANHPDAAAALIVDGTIKAAVAEERFTRNKHEGGIPKHAIEFCLSQSPRTPDIIAVGRNRSVHRTRKLLSLVRYPTLIPSVYRASSGLHKSPSIQQYVEQIAHTAIPIHYVEHHVAHLAQAYVTSPFPTCALLSVDGFGDFESAAWGTAQNGNIHLTNRVFFPHSIGVVYSAVTHFLGFDQFGEEYKIMALAAYGTPKFKKEMDRLITPTRNGFAINSNAFEHTKRYTPITTNANNPRLWSQQPFHALFGKERKRSEDITQREMNIAASLQEKINEIILHVARIVKQKTGKENLALAGGVALNGVANGVLARSGLFKEIWIGSAPADDGTALGAAARVAMQNKEMRIPNIHNSSPFLGPSSQNPSFYALYSKENKWRRKIHDKESFEEEIVRLLNDGNIVGWYEGGMEFGPRALGHRSILADARNPQMKEKINATIKRREWFRPFAPMVLKEDASTYFHISQQSPNMMIVTDIRDEWASRFPAIAHYDRTARVQTVDAVMLPNITSILHAWKRKTGVSVLLNTSFNENEPIVNTLDQALDCAHRANIDAIAMPQVTK